MRLKQIEDQVVVVVGASSGIGRETAHRFARRGARVVAAARNEQGLQTLIDEIRRGGGEITAVVADVTDFDQVKRIADTAVDRYGRIDTWVHLAAVSLYAAFDDTTPDEFRQVIETNLVGQAYGAMAALPYLKQEGRGALIHVSSVEGEHALPLQSAYSASKHGLVGMLDALRMELQHEGLPISVTNIMPASINTPLFDKARTKLGVKPKPVPPVYEPELVADAILFAAEHPRDSMVVGGAGRAVMIGDRVSPALTDMYFRRTAFRSQRSEQPKSLDAPDALFGPISGYNTVQGTFTEQASGRSPYTWLQTHPTARTALFGAAIGGSLLAMGLVGFALIKGAIGLAGMAAGRTAQAGLLGAAAMAVDRIRGTDRGRRSTRRSARRREEENGGLLSTVWGWIKTIATVRIGQRLWSGLRSAIASR